MAYYILKSYKLKAEPFEVFRALKDGKNCFFLDSSLNSNCLGRYSFLGIEPFRVLSASNKNPFHELREALSRYKIYTSFSNFPFLGGAVGYLAYDLGLKLEPKVKIMAKDSAGLPDCFFGFYNAGIIFDNKKKLMHIFSSGLPEKNSLSARLLARNNFKKLQALISKVGFKRQGPEIKNKVAPRVEFESNFSKPHYLKAVERAKHYIKAGDIYQVNLSQEFSARTASSAFEIYQNLRRISPSYFSAYMDCGDFQIISSSPERFLYVEDKVVTTRPMKGTRPRSGNSGIDRKFKKELLASAKDKAELMMIVDLERNDLGRVCNYDSIRVDTLRNIEEYNTVFQTTASISGELYRDKDRFDLLGACFPGGSITGCPKIRAMEIIEELEPHRRFIYTGALGYLSFTGSMDFSILIRTILKKNNAIKFGVGGGIVADSKAEDEYNETLVKARAMMEAINEA